MSTDLHKRTMAQDGPRADLMRKVWRGFPWMIDAFTGSCAGERYDVVAEWCREQFGQEASPIHDIPGRWQRGLATIYGWTWFGFADPADYRLFCERWAQGSDQ